MKPARKHPRLDDKSLYSDPSRITHIIIKFVSAADNDLYVVIKSVLINTAEEKHLNIYAFSIMPDHIYILTSQNNDFGVIEFVKTVKGRVKALVRNCGIKIEFQTSFYDHILRKDEDVVTVAKYIINNPVRKGITGLFGDHVYSGSLVYKF